VVGRADVPTLIVFLAIALGAGVALVIDRRTPVAPVLGIVVVTTTMAVGDGSAVFAGVLVAACATAVSRKLGRATERRLTLGAVAIAGAIGGVVAAATANPESAPGSVVVVSALSPSLLWPQSRLRVVEVRLTRPRW
jgi:hypothetical protein